MATIIGTISEFNREVENITEWMERLEQYFIANSIEGAPRKRAVLISVIGASGYRLLRSLSQNDPTGKSYSNLKTLLLDHLQPKPNEISQRYVFYKRERRAGESVKQYVAELRKLSEYCNFGDKLEES